MKKICILISMLVFGLLSAPRASAQANEIAQLLLNVQKLSQFTQILKDMKAGYQILNGGYNTIKNISQGNFKLHKQFLDGLMQVSPTVRNYRRVHDIINYQLILVKEYKKAYERYSHDDNFTVEELAYISRVYNNLLKSSLRNLDELTGIVTAGKMRMSDDERLQGIDRIYLDMQDKLLFLRHFNNNTSILAVQRAKEKNDVNAMQSIYGINN